MKVSMGKGSAPDPLTTFASGMGATSSKLGHPQAQEEGATSP